MALKVEFDTSQLKGVTKKKVAAFRRDVRKRHKQGLAMLSNGMKRRVSMGPKAKPRFHPKQKVKRRETGHYPRNPSKLLRVITGTLRASIGFAQVVVRQGEWIGRVGPQRLEYARIHEFGGIIPARWVSPKQAKALMFLKKGGGSGKKGFAFSKGHLVGPIKIKKRPYMRPTLRKDGPEVAQHIGKALEKLT